MKAKAEKRRQKEIFFLSLSIHGCALGYSFPVD